jgi:hypothetical protein
MLQVTRAFIAPVANSKTCAEAGWGVEKVLMPTVKAIAKEAVNFLLW